VQISWPVRENALWHTHLKTFCSTVDEMVKEEPNTNGVVVWPKGVADENSSPQRVNARRRSRDASGLNADGLNGLSPVDDEYEVNVTDYVPLTVSPLSRYWGEKMEFSLLFFLGSIAWVVGVNYCLRKLRFPIHLHQKEVIAMYILPIFIVYLVLKLVDWITVPPGPSFETEHPPPSPLLPPSHRSKPSISAGHAAARPRMPSWQDDKDS
jgi:hypothetical protein